MNEFRSRMRWIRQNAPLRRLERWLEGPMVVLAFVWIGLLTIEFAAGEAGCAAGAAGRCSCRSSSGQPEATTGLSGLPSASARQTAARTEAGRQGSTDSGSRGDDEEDDGSAGRRAMAGMGVADVASV